MLFPTHVLKYLINIKELRYFSSRVEFDFVTHVSWIYLSGSISACFCWNIQWWRRSLEKEIGLSTHVCDWGTDEDFFQITLSLNSFMFPALYWWWGGQSQVGWSDLLIFCFPSCCGPSSGFGGSGSCWFSIALVKKKTISKILAQR